MKYDAVLLASFGGPESPEDVMPFLERVTAGRGVPRERLEEVSHHYLALGGVSPVNEQNRKLLGAVRDELKARSIEIPIYWGNRNSEPFYAQTLLDMHAVGHKNILALVTSAYSSYSGCRQYRENLAAALVAADLVGKMRIDKVRHYFDHPGFIGPFAKGLSEALSRFVAEGLSHEKVKILFTTHSIPHSMADSSGPTGSREKYEGGMYIAQHMAVANLVIQEAASHFDGDMPAWQLVYQSRSGSPQTPWLEPDIGDAIRDIAGAEIKGIIVVPIGFVSDHVEVVWDLDKEAREIAESEGLRFTRVATPGVSREFVSGLVDLISERTDASERKALSELGPWSDFCSSGCCPNPRMVLPVIAEVQV